MTNMLKPQSLVPDLPGTNKVCDESGNLTPAWFLFFSQLVTATQTNFKPEGFVMPQVSGANIAVLTAVESLANIVYDSTDNVFKGNVLTAPNTYTWKTFDMS